MSPASTSSSSDLDTTSSPINSKRQWLKRKRLDQNEFSDSESNNSDASRKDGVEVSALSHAARRREKKEESKKQNKLTSDCPSVAKKRRLKDGVAATSVSKKETRQNSVWVGNLSFKTTPEALRGFLDGVGEITRIHMPMKAGVKGVNMGSVF
jgi:RNA recognition motif-containing protein